MELESLKVGRMYLVKQGKKLLNLRLKQIQATTRKGTDLYELKITTTGYQLWMLDESIGKGYTIRNFAQIKDEVKERPKKGSLVQITSGKLVKTLGSITVYRVADVRRDDATHEPMVELYGDFKNYLLPMSDVKVYESTGIDPETLLSKESKAIGDMPRKMLPTSTRTKKGLLDFVTQDVPFGSMSDEVVMTKEERLKEEKEAEEKESKKKLQAELDAKKPTSKDDGSWQVRKAKAVKATGKVPLDKVARAREVRERRQSLSTQKGQSSKVTTASKPQSKKPKGRQLKAEGEQRPDPISIIGADSVDARSELDSEQSVIVSVNQSEDNNDPDEVDPSLEKGDRPAHLADVVIPMDGGQIAESYLEAHPLKKEVVMKQPLTTKQIKRRTGH